jgi:signal transduction histidine kinase
MVQMSLADLQQSYTLYAGISDARGQAKALLNIGGIYSDAGDYQRSLQYYSQIPDIYKGDPAVDLAVHNNLGETLRKLARFKEAEAEYRVALIAAKQIDSPLLEVRILTNLASAEFQRGALDEADSTAQHGITISHNGEAAGWRPFLWGVQAQVALQRGNLAAAKTFIESTFAGSDGNTLPYIDFHETAYQIYQRLGDYQRALEHLEAFKKLDDQEKKLTSSGNSALMAARFDFANQNLRIERLKSDQVLRDVQMAQSKARFHMIVLGLLLGVGMVLVAGLSVAFLSIRRSRNEVRAANEDLHDANTSLEKALKVKTEFLATTSHEIRTPLNGILGMTQVLLADRSIGSGLRDKIKVVHGAGETMRALVDDILDVAKIESGNLTVERTAIDLRRLVEDTASLWRGQAEAKGLSLVLDERDYPRAIEEDEGKLRQIVFNLMSNAIKFTEAGTILFGIGTTTDAEGEHLLLEIRDSGIGIAPEQHALIFESFRQADGGTARRFGGTGLGLSICKSLAEALGGRLTVASRLGEGSAFSLRLPLRRCASRAVEGPDHAADAAACTLADATLLLVETNPLTRRIMVKLLEPAVRQLVLAEDGEDAIVQLAAGGVAHILVEAASATRDGDTVPALRILAAAAERSGARMTILFSPGEHLSVDAFGGIGATQVVAKPISGAALVRELGMLYPGAEAEAPAPCHQAAAG